MLITELLLHLFSFWPFILPLSLLSHLLYTKYQRGLNKYPGPYLASLSDLWQVFAAVRSFQHHPYLQLHAQYGDIVRVAPNKLSFADPAAIRDILGPGKDFRKSGFYFVSAATANGHAAPSLFSTLDKDYHDRIKRAVNNAFSVTSLVHYEPYVDRVIGVWLEQVGRRFADKQDGGKAGGVVNLQQWLHYYSLDVIGEVVYGQQYGFLKTGEDVDFMARDTQKMLNYAYWAGQAPWLDLVFMKNPITMWLTRKGWIGSRTNPAVVSAMKSQSARLRQESEDVEKASEETHEDLLDQFIKAKHEHPGSISDREILMLGISMVFAGSDTTAWTLCAFFYYVLRTKGVYERLVKELLEKTDAGIVPYTTAQKLPYLDACIKETFRMHPAARFSSERVVPPGGATICGERVEGGTVVGINAWVIHRRKDIWGDDVDVFRPERWLEDEDRSKRMAGMLFQFGAGNFNCLGRNISLLEMYKITAAALREFEWELVDGEGEWTLAEGSFARPERLDARIRRRKHG